MAISLSKGQKVSLEKDGKKLTKIAMGLGWDAEERKGLFGFGSRKIAIDLDASCLCFNESGRCVDNVYFAALKSKDGAIKHSGDNRTGDGDGDDETITVDLNRVSANIKTMVFVVNSYTGQNFEEVANASCRLYNIENGEEFANFKLTEKGKHTGLIMMKVYRHNGEWKVGAIGEVCNGRVASQLIDQCKKFL